MKVVYITGCLGFIGSYVTRACLDAGWYVRGIDKCTYAANVDLLDEFETNPKFTFEKIDINDIPFLYDCDYVINLAAESHVGNSIVRSDEFIHSNINGIHHLLELIRNRREGHNTTLLHFSCYDKETRALTTDGLKSFNEIRIGDTVVSISKQGAVEFKKVLKVITQSYIGPMVHFKNRSNDLMVTPNHRMYYQIDGNIRYKQAKDIRGNKTKYLYPRGKLQGNVDTTILVPNIGMVDSKTLLYVCGMFIGDGFLAKQQKVVKNKTGLSRPEYLQRCRDNKGCFTSATNIGNQTSTICHSYRIFFDVPENDNNRKKLELALTKLDIKWKAHNNKSGEHIYFASQAWCNFFEQFGKYAKNKTIPSWMFQYDYSILQELYDGLIGSDGYINPSGTGILTTVSKSLMEQSCILGTCLGYMMKVDKIPPQTSIYKNRTIRGNFDTYYIHFNQQDVTINGPNDNLTPYDDTIWCLQVEDNKNFVVERNGIFKISGNTDEVYGDITEGTHKETDLLKPSNPYSATKAAGDMLILAWARTYGVPYIIVRPTNNYGVGQYVEKLIPKACKCLFLGKKIPLHNEGKPVRNWLHAADTAQAIMRIIDFGRINQIYNIAGHFEQANIETIKQILKAMDYGDDTHHYVSQETRKGQDVRYAVDDRKLTSLGWYPSHKFEEELSEIVQYYRNKFIW